MSNETISGQNDEESTDEWTKTDDLLMKLGYEEWMGGLYGIGVLLIQLVFLWYQNYLQAIVWFGSAIIVWKVIVTPRNDDVFGFLGGTDE
jgi:hypothetical protein